MKNNLNTKISNSVKWSSVTEIVSKLVQPITTMALVRILSPESFGVVATITMIISFADMFTDVGFQKYIIQHEFDDDNEKELCINVAFWTNIMISLIMSFVIIIFSDKISTLVGNAGLGNVISVACINLPLTSFSSIQLAIYKRNFEYKKLFKIRFIGLLIPFFVTIPLAILGYSYWSLIIGTLCSSLYNSIILTVKSSWRPKLKYDINVLKKMTSFSIWSLVEGISIWLSTWLDTFIVGSILSTYYLGIYKTSMNVLDSIFAIISSSITPILFTSLSRVQNDNEKFNKIYFSIQKNVSYIVIPMSVGIFIFRDLIIKVFLGSEWMEASYVVGLWGLFHGLKIVIGNYSSEVFRAKGMPKLSFIAQVINIILLVPACIVGAKYGFKVLVEVRVLVRIQLMLVQLIFMHLIMKISIKNIINNLRIPIIASVIMAGISYILVNVSDDFMWNIISILISILVYFGVLMMFKESRDDILNQINNIIIKKRMELNKI